MIHRFSVGQKEAALYTAEAPDQPLIVLHCYEDEGGDVLSALRALGGPDFNLLVVSHLNWNHDMAPWDCPPVFGNDEPITGGAEEHLKVLLSEILPRAGALVPGVPAWTGIAGYSLAGLFALWTLYQCETFDRAASVSGSLWFPDFREYALSHAMKKAPEKLYLSLGDKEDKTRNPLLRTVRECTEAIAAYYRQAGLDVVWEMNPGNHFRDGALRTAKGIMAIL